MFGMVLRAQPDIPEIVMPPSVTERPRAAFRTLSFLNLFEYPQPSTPNADETADKMSFESHSAGTSSTVCSNRS